MARKQLKLGLLEQPNHSLTKKKTVKLTGCEIEVLREIFKDSDKYEVNFNKTEWSSVFAGLDSDRFQIGANNISYSKERGRKIPLSKSICSQSISIGRTKDSSIKSFG